MLIKGFVANVQAFLRQNHSVIFMVYMNVIKGHAKCIISYMNDVFTFLKKQKKACLLGIVDKLL